ncbi:MAG TPA: alpha/beta fold hydrolase [Polyangiaceae bacterium]|nr:alpha/beta fold hydrolase [Polyangiaceae bacterium]
MAIPVALEELIGVERLALLREVALVPRDLAAVVPRALPGEDVVVLVHGFFASAGVFRPLRARLERETGAHVATFTHAPGVGIRRIARRLARLVDQFPHGTHITVVGHSLGGIVARWYVQELGGHQRVARTISLASPFGGIDVPPLLVGADLHEQSALLRRLREHAHVCGVPHTSIVGEDDSVVVGVETASLGFGEVVVVPRRGHNALLFCDRVAGLVIDGVKTRTA